MLAVQPGVAPERRTPPMFSKRKEIREAAAREGRQYAPEEFDVDEDQWVHGPDFFQDKLGKLPVSKRVFQRLIAIKTVFRTFSIRTKKNASERRFSRSAI